MSIRESAVTDQRHRPQYHFLPPAHWMNDPNGLIQWKGQYHLFYQYHPFAATSGPKYWGHAVSSNLVHWQHLPVALAPTLAGADKDGCWSGCAVDNDGIPTLIYTGVHPQVQCVATSVDDLLTWTKYPGNPVIAAPPQGMSQEDFRDPCVWKEGDTWKMVVGSAVPGVGGAVLLYRSRDLLHWEYVGPLCVGDKAQTGEIWECPNFFPLGDRYVLIISPIPFGRAIYLVGDYDGTKFVPTVQGELDQGGCFYAPQVMLDDTRVMRWSRGRCIMFGWLWEGRSEQAQLDAGWAGVMSLPRMLYLRADGSLGVEPVFEVHALRGKHHRWVGVGAEPRTVQGDCLEIIAQFEPGASSAGAFGLKVRCSPDGEEQTAIAYDRRTAELSIDYTRASRSMAARHGVCATPLPLAPGESLQLHVFLDRSVVEVYANSRICLTSRIYPERADSLGFGPFAERGDAPVVVLDAWEMKPIWKDTP